MRFGQVTSGQLLRLYFTDNFDEPQGQDDPNDDPAP